MNEIGRALQVTENSATNGCHDHEQYVNITSSSNKIFGAQTFGVKAMPEAIIGLTMIE